MGDERDLFRLEPVSEATQGQAKGLIWEGMKEHFAVLDLTLNPDLNNIMESYVQQGSLFLVGMMGDEVVCTGALLSVNETTGRIVRMSVKKTYRRNGFASRMIEALEQAAVRRGHSGIFLKTLHHWSDAVGFYERLGYRAEKLAGESVTFVKELQKQTVQ